MKLGTATKLMKVIAGGMNPPELLSVLEDLGIQIQFEMVPEDRKEDAFQHVAQAAIDPASEVILLRSIISGDDGTRQVHCLMVMGPLRPAYAQLPARENSLDTVAAIALS